MSPTESITLQAAAASFSFNARPILYTPLDGVPLTVSAIVGAIAGGIQDPQIGRVDLNVRPVSLLVSDVAAPARGDQLTIDGDVWTIENTLSRNAAVSVVNATRPITLELAQPGYRNRV